MAVRKGDVIGFYFPGNSIIPFDGSECYTRRTLYVKSPIASRLKPGAIHYFSTKRGGWNPCRAYSLQVRIALVNGWKNVKTIHSYGYILAWAGSLLYAIVFYIFHSDMSDRMRLTCKIPRFSNLRTTGSQYPILSHRMH